MPVIQSIRKNSRLFFDVHMMVEEPGRYVQAMKESGADLLTVHAEACTHLDRTLSAIREAGMKAAVALNPAPRWKPSGMCMTSWIWFCR